MDSGKRKQHIIVNTFKRPNRFSGFFLIRNAQSQGFIRTETTEEQYDQNRFIIIY